VKLCDGSSFCYRQQASEFLVASQMKTIPNLLLIAGTGTKSGKTSMVCKIIEQFSNLKITAIKISPHFHETTRGLIPICEDKGYSIYEETDNGTSKDTSRMLRAGAAKVYFSKVWDEQLLTVFNKIMEQVPTGGPIICESPALRNFAEPGVFIIMASDLIHKYKNMNQLKALPHLLIKLEELDRSESVPVAFDDGRWRCKE
jgi:hypothetical protein